MTTFTRGENGKPSRLTTGLLVGSVLFGLSYISGCSGPGTPAFLEDTFAREVRELEDEMRNPKKTGDPWAGTAVVNKQVYPDGTVIFLINANKVSHKLTWDYTDSFINSENYNKKVRLIQENMGVVEYTPR